MRKLIYTCTILWMYGLFAMLHGQTTLVEWPLNTSTGVAPDNYNASILSPSNLKRGNGIGSIQVDVSGAKARAWYPQNAVGMVDYYEVCITPKPGVTLQIDALQFDEHTDVNGISGFEVYASSNGFQHSTLVGSAVIPPNNTSVRSHNFDNLDLRICESVQLCFRMYGYGASNQNAFWFLEEQSLNIQGTVMPICTPPTTQGNVGFSNVGPNSLQVEITNGNGNARMIVMSEGDAVSAMPCSGFTYPASTTFGNGYELGMDEYVVYAGPANAGNSTSVMVDGLTEGATYHVAVFEYDSGSDCFNKVNPATNSTITTCMGPTEPIQPMASPGSDGISLGWTDPLCNDEVLVMASTAPITGAPDGDGTNITANLTFGAGTFTGTTFPASAFPVFLGTAGRVDVVGLTPNTTYYFKLFTRIGTSWSAGVELSAKSAEGCTDLGGHDVVFINEVHYTNWGEDMDEGVELAGPAGTDLTPYQLYLYEQKDGSLTKGIPYGPVTDFYGTIDNEDGQMGAVWFPIPEIEDYTGGFVLYNTVRKEIVQFLTYRQILTGEGGIADSILGERMMTASNAIARELNDPSFPAGMSMQLVGTGECPSDFDWVPQLAATPGVLNDQQAVLPIELLDFKASIVDEDVLLQWQTATEINNDYMAIERSADGRHFEEIDWLPGAGTTYEPQAYQIWDKNPLAGINYYRLRQVDFDGTATYHKVISVRFDGKPIDAAIYPTVVDQELTIVYGSPISGEGQLDVVDLNGRSVLSRQVNEGEVSMILPVGDLDNGHYILRIEYHNESIIKRFFVLR